MTWEDEGLEPGESPEDRREFWRMLDALGREGIRRMIEQLTGEIEANPQDTGSRYTRGLLYNELGEHRRAAADYGRIIDLDPGNANAYHGRARARSEMGERRLAVEDYDAAIRLAPRQRGGPLRPGGVPGRTGQPGRGDERLRPGGWPPTRPTPGTTRGLTRAASPCWRWRTWAGPSSWSPAWPWPTTHRGTAHRDLARSRPWATSTPP